MRYSCMPCNPVAVGVISTKRPNFRTVGLLHSSCLVVASSTKVSCGRNWARMTNTSRNGIGAKRSRAISVSHWAHALGLPLPTRKFFSSRACASSMEAICCPATQLCSSISNSWSGRWRLDTNKLIATVSSEESEATSRLVLTTLSGKDFSYAGVQDVHRGEQFATVTGMGTWHGEVTRHLKYPVGSSLSGSIIGSPSLCGPRKGSAQGWWRF